ncbi:MAG: metalloregulator ArsR/SmtB family transcription factor [Pseudohongiellaceae bacterium]
MPKQSTELNQIFHALADPTRMAVIARLAEGPAAVSELARPFDMALPSFTQHLGVLEKNGLVRSRKRGRSRTYQLRADTLKLATTWLEERGTLWEKRLDQLDEVLLTLKKENE